MSRTTNDAPLIRSGVEPSTFTATWNGRLSGVLSVRFHGANRATVSDMRGDGILCGAHRYRVTLHYARTGDGWTVDETPGVPAVRRDNWTRPAPTIDRRIRDAAHSFLTMVANLYPEALTAAEVSRLKLARDSAAGKVRDLREQLTRAQRELASAERELADAERATR